MNDIELITLNPSFEAFGAVIDFLSGMPPFKDFEVGSLARAIRDQLGTERHVAAMLGREMVGYAGWLFTTDELAAAWVAGAGPLRSLSGPEAVAAVLTIVAVTDNRATALLIRRARELNPGKRAYFKRDNVVGVRKNSVLIFSGEPG